jgi:hypothetical protein
LKNIARPKTYITGLSLFSQIKNLSIELLSQISLKKTNKVGNEQLIEEIVEFDPNIDIVLAGPKRSNFEFIVPDKTKVSC